MSSNEKSTGSQGQTLNKASYGLERTSRVNVRVSTRVSPQDCPLVRVRDFVTAVALGIGLGCWWSGVHTRRGHSLVDWSSDQHWWKSVDPDLKGSPYPDSGNKCL